MAKPHRWRQNSHLQVWNAKTTCWTVPCCFGACAQARLALLHRQPTLLTPGVPAGANKAVALYQLGQVNESMREMRCVQSDGSVHAECSH